MSQEKVVLDEDDVRRTLVRIAHEIVEKNPDGQVALAASTAAAPTSPPGCTGWSPGSSRPSCPPGEIDIAFYRDDLATREAPEVRSSHLPSGWRTTRSSSSTTCSTPAGRCAPAIEALFDYGRPGRVQLAVLADPATASSRSAPTTSARTSRPTAPSA